MKQRYLNMVLILSMGLFAFLLGGCSEKYELSEMKFDTSFLSDTGTLHVTSSSPEVPIAGNQDRIIYIDLEGNIVCYDCATDTEKILVRATSSDDYYSAGSYSSIVLDGNKVYYRVFGLNQWDMIYCVDVDSSRRQKIGRIYMDSPFYVQDGEVYGTENLQEQLNTKDHIEFEDDSSIYNFKMNHEFIVFDGKVYQQVVSRDNRDVIVFDLNTGGMDKITSLDNARLFYSNQNNIYYSTDTEFGEIIGGAMQKIIDLKDFDVSHGYINVQIFGEYIVIDNDSGTHIYNKNTNSLEAHFSYGEHGPYYVNGELIYRFDSASYSFLEFFEEIGQGYYSLNIEKAIELS